MSKGKWACPHTCYRLSAEPPKRVWEWLEFSGNQWLLEKDKTFTVHCDGWIPAPQVVPHNLLLQKQAQGTSCLVTPFNSACVTYMTRKMPAHALVLVCPALVRQSSICNTYPSIPVEGLPAVQVAGAEDHSLSSSFPVWIRPIVGLCPISIPEWRMPSSLVDPCSALVSDLGSRDVRSMLKARLQVLKYCWTGSKEMLWWMTYRAEGLLKVSFFWNLLQKWRNLMASCSTLHK